MQHFLLFRLETYVFKEQLVDKEWTKSNVLIETSVVSCSHYFQSINDGIENYEQWTLLNY